uniref:DnaJ C-terminal domain-containing protein n=1 Tax=uncultured Altererythrobacter sp. TaxID=500840 RepID=UPI00261F3D07|nr:DnaJ C-terminal domain-containing protein [uncultured Altererythrobacter sp.]
MSDPYSILGIARTASEKEIKSAYRKLAKELHPDRNKGKPDASERFSNVTKAYDLLSDADKRARFDRGEIDAEGNPTNPFAGGFGGGGFNGRPGGGGSGGPQGFRPEDFDGFGTEGVDLSDLFDGLFGGGGQRRSSGMGGGFGSQRRPPPQKGPDVHYRLAVPFVSAASREDQRITLADGKTISVKLPAGVDDGTQMRLKGKGKPGPGGNGDGLVMVEIGPHPFYRRDGDHIRMDLPITLDEALNGAKVKCPTADGPVMLTIKPGTNGGTVMRLKGKGWSTKSGGRGDQLVTLEIQMPEDPDELSKRLEGWKDNSNPRAKLGM